MRRGFTLVEMVVVLAIIIILTSMGIVMSSEMIPRYRTLKAARLFAAKLNECRATAVRTNRECSVWIVTADSALSDPSTNDGEFWVGLGDSSWDSSSWDYLPEDKDIDGSDDDTSQGIIDIGDQTGDYYMRRVGLSYTPGTVGGPGTGNTDRIVYSPRGFLTNPVTDFDSYGNIEVRFVNKQALANGVSESYVVSVTRAGMTRIDNSVNPSFSGMSSGTTLSSTP